VGLRLGQLRARSTRFSFFGFLKVSFKVFESNNPQLIEASLKKIEQSKKIRYSHTRDAERLLLVTFLTFQAEGSLPNFFF
jgi:hypothetical protein